jgi:putative transposase
MPSRPTSPVLDYRPFYSRHLPHYQPPGAMLFLTTRLAGSLPREVILRLLGEAEQKEAFLAGVTDPQERAEQAYLEQRRQFGEWDAELHLTKQGPFWLSDPRVAQLVADSLRYRSGQVYRLVAFCIMPNHLHLVIVPLPKEDGRFHSLTEIMHSLKRYTARQANLLLGREGAFWQAESYDHVVRDEAEARRIIEYVLNNPVKAGLVQSWEDWPWNYVAQDAILP